MKQQARLKRPILQGTESCPTARRELNTVNNRMRTEVDPSLFEPSEETPVLGDSLIATLWEIL